MVQDKTLSARLFDYGNITLMVLLGLICILPFIHITAVSLSSA